MRRNLLRGVSPTSAAEERAEEARALKAIVGPRPPRVQTLPQLELIGLIDEGIRAHTLYLEERAALRRSRDSSEHGGSPPTSPGEGAKRPGVKRMGAVRRLAAFGEPLGTQAGQQAEGQTKGKGLEGQDASAVPAEAVAGPAEAVAGPVEAAPAATPPDPAPPPEEEAT